MIDRRTFARGLALSSAVLSSAAPGLAPRPAAAEPRAAAAGAGNVVLVHGLFADGSSWSPVIRRLLAAGLNPTAVQHPLTTLAESVAATRRVLDRQDGPTVLVGHSFGGLIVSETGLHPKVAALVYVAARAPDAGEDFAALAARFPSPPAAAGVVFDEGGEGRLSHEAFLRDFAGDLPEAEARVLHAVQKPFRRSLTGERTSRAAWRERPAYYAVSAHDRTIDPDLQRLLAARMGAETIELPASHLSLISRADEVAALILRAARNTSPA